MKRSEMKILIKDFLRDNNDEDYSGFIDIDRLLDFIEKNGMKPPRLPEAHCQALSSLYYGGYTTAQWEEDFEKDQKAVEELKRYRERKRR